MKTVLHCLVAMIVLFACQSQEQERRSSSEAYQQRPIAYNEALRPFFHGVASGDPLSDRVIIWTRVTPEQNRPTEVQWRVAEDSTFAAVVQQGTVTTSEAQDYTVKVDVTGLKADQRYYYQFEVLQALSPRGRTKTAPVADKDSLRLAFASCSNYEFGYFNAYGHMAQQPLYDAVVHLGDYIYEYGVGEYGDTTYGRFNVPAHELFSLEDYRTRYALYRAESELQAAHAAHPWITIWDDHEISNNAYTEGAQNHSPDTEGDYQSRRAAAVQAYYEWLPVRGKAGEPLYRSFDFGSLAHLMVLDGRLAGRSAPADSVETEAYLDSSRHMLGSSQLGWLEQELAGTPAIWKVIGNQVIFSGLDASQLPGPDKYMDMWDGYPVERARFIDFLQKYQIRNLIIGTGDFHSSLGLEIPDNPLDPSTYQRSDPAQGQGVEFVVHSVNASNVNEWVGEDTARMVERVYRDPAYNPHVRHANTSDHGYVELLLYPQEARIHWKYLTTLRERDYSLKKTHSMVVVNQQARLEPQ